jgi:transcriptional regulator with XRE-family HTH domain
MSRKTDDLDRHIGLRLKMRRILCGLSQDDLSKELGITFQQVQKYEKAMNRISASRLYDIAKILKTTLEYFYEGYEEAETLHEKTMTTKEYLASLPQKKSYTANDILARVIAMPSGADKQRILKNIEKEFDSCQ